MPNSRRPTLLLIAAVAVFAAILGVRWFPEHPLTAAVVLYVAATLSLAHALGMPEVRTLAAVVLLTIAAVVLALRAARAVIDALLWILGFGGTAGVRRLRTEPVA